MSSPTSAPAPSASADFTSVLNGGAGKGTQQQGQSVQTFFASLGTGFVLFSIQVGFFLAFKNRMSRIYEPRTYLVPYRQLAIPPPKGLWRWLIPVIQTHPGDYIHKCGLDAFFFLRYLRMLLKIFLPAAFFIVLILVPLNKVNGRGASFATGIYANRTTYSNVTGLDQLAWGNVRPTQNNRYWVHLILAVFLVIYVCFVFWEELRGYIRIRQSHLTSPQHRIRASATTVLVTNIPPKWLTFEALDGLYDVFPGGVRNIWINRDYNALGDKCKQRDAIAAKLEKAYTALIRNARKAYMKRIKKTGESSKIDQYYEEEAEERAKFKEQKAKAEAEAQAKTENEKAQAEAEQAKAKEDPGTAMGDKGKAKEEQGTTKEDKGKAKEGQDEETAYEGGACVGGPHHVLHSLDGASDARPEMVKEEPGNKIAGQGETGADDQHQVPHTLEQAASDKEQEGTTTFHDIPSPTPHGQKRELPPRNPSSAAARCSPQTSVSDEKSHEDRERYEPNPQKRRIEFAIQMHPKEMYARPAWEEDEDDGEPVWKQYLKDKDRETMRLPVFGLKWMPSLPLIGKKVDVIIHCQKELARLNLEIEKDQQEPDKYPLMNSAFIQFNNQVAAHMACQAVSHHRPYRMTPRVVEISPDDVIWDNMAMKWWESYLRTAIVVLAIIGLVIGWAIPVTFTGLLSQVRYIAHTFSWLAWLGRTPSSLLAIIQGVLPQAILALLLFLLPVILRVLVIFKGTPTNVAAELSMQNYYFFFLFVQVFLVVSISSGITTVIQQITKAPQSIPSILAQNLPKASNYFFSYLVLQAMSTSASTLLQFWGLVQWYIMAPLFDTTARQRWKRQTCLPLVSWGTFFPVYTNLAAIGLVYSVISPLILILCTVTFGLFWIVFRYNMLYVSTFRLDSGGMFFPKAINQLFTGLYVMELCLIGLFILVRDVDSAGNAIGTPCTGQAIVMILVLIGTIAFQWLLNDSFGPLFRYLPITLEDEAVERDELFALAQQKRSNQTRNVHEDKDHVSEEEHLRERRQSFERDFLQLHKKAVKLSNAYDRFNMRKEPFGSDGKHDSEISQSRESSEEYFTARSHEERENSSQSDLHGLKNFEEREPRARKHAGNIDPGKLQNTSETDLYGVSNSEDRRRRKKRREYYKHLEERQQCAVEESWNYVKARRDICQLGARGMGYDGNDDHDDLGEGQESNGSEQGSVVVKRLDSHQRVDLGERLQDAKDEGMLATVESWSSGGRGGLGKRLENTEVDQRSVGLETSSPDGSDERTERRPDEHCPIAARGKGPRPLSRAMGLVYPALEVSKPASKIGWAERSRKDWAARSPRFEHNFYETHERKHTRPHTDLESQSSGFAPEGLFAESKTQLEQLSLEERDYLVRHAFQHEAMRWKRPVIWIPKDELGVSDDEIYLSQRFSKNIWITNWFAALDGKCEVIYSRAPPDWDDVDMIKL